MSAWDLVQWANAVVARDEETERRFTVPQEPWPSDGSLPVAAHFLRWVDPDTGEREIKWTGTVYGFTVSCITRGAAEPVRVKPTFEMFDGVPTIHIRLVDDAGYTRSRHIVDLLNAWL